MSRRGYSAALMSGYLLDRARQAERERAGYFGGGRIGRACARMAAEIPPRQRSNLRPCRHRTSRLRINAIMTAIRYLPERLLQVAGVGDGKQPMHILERVTKSSTPDGLLPPHWDACLLRLWCQPHTAEPRLGSTVRICPGLPDSLRPRRALRLTRRSW